jgi:AbrB family looped-hinge helix DNA binding protein
MHHARQIIDSDGEKVFLMAAVSKVGRRGQITLPSAVRRLLGLAEGDRVAFVRQGEVVVLQRMPRSLREERGTVPVTGALDFDAVRAVVRSERARHATEGDADA